MSKLQVFRGKLIELGVDAFIIGSGDAHQSEYVHESDMRRAFISDFTGSAGTALVLASKNEAYLWTDGRYFLQASQELSSDWTLMRSGEPNVLELNDWLATNLKSGSVVGVDPSLMSTSQAKGLEKQLLSKGIVLKAVAANPVDAVWAASRPAVPNSPVTVHPIEYAGVHHSEKIAKVQKELEKTNSVAFVVSMLDEVFIDFCLLIYSFRISFIYYIV